MARPSAEQIESMKKANPGAELHLIDLGDTFGQFVVKTPSRLQWHAFKDQVADKAHRKIAMENLVVVCAVAPNGDLMGQVIDKYPALAETIAAKLGEMAGLVEGAEAEKL